MAVPRERLTAHLLDLGLIEAEDVTAIDALVAAARDAGGVHLEEHDMLGVAQAIGRAADRVASAGADVAVRRLDHLPDDERELAADAWMTAILPVVVSTFGLFCERRARQIARRRLEATAGGAHVQPPVAVAFVDLRGSTAFLLDHSAREVEALADELYTVGQEVATHHDVAAGKFLGDGMLLVSADTGRLIAAAREAVTSLGRRTPLRAGAGVAWGHVIRRAGDWHGPPVNLAARLAEVAAADEILVDGAALTEGEDASATWRDVVPRGVRDPRRVAVFTSR